jgi:hypothetical protein
MNSEPVSHEPPADRIVSAQSAVYWAHTRTGQGGEIRGDLEEAACARGLCAVVAAIEPAEYAGAVLGRTVAATADRDANAREVGKVGEVVAERGGVADPVLVRLRDDVCLAVRDVRALVRVERLRLRCELAQERRLRRVRARHVRLRRVVLRRALRAREAREQHGRQRRRERGQHSRGALSAAWDARLIIRARNQAAVLAHENAMAAVSQPIAFLGTETAGNGSRGRAHHCTTAAWKPEQEECG